MVQSNLQSSVKSLICKMGYSFYVITFTIAAKLQMFQFHSKLLCATLLLSSTICMIGYSLAAPEDEALNEILDFLPKGFLEKPVVAIGTPGKSANQDKPNNAKTDDLLKAAQSMVSGLNSIVKGLNSPDNGDCLFKCQKGKPVARKGFKPVPNGCGTHGLKADVSELPGITECCNQHDICYGTCNSGQAVCDRQFHDCMDSSCNTMKSSGVIKDDKRLEECKAIGATFYLAAMTVGCEFYRESQQAACQCPPAAAVVGASNSAGTGGSQDRIRQHNSEKRAREAERGRKAKSKSDSLVEDPLDNIDMSSPEFDLPDAIDHQEL